MPALVLSQTDVRALLPMEACIDRVADALATLGRGNAVNPLRRGIRVPDRDALLGMMPGYLSDPPALGLKVVAVFPSNHGTRFDSHQGVVMLFELDHGTPVAIMDASEITAIRTAAATGVATRLLARPDAREVALIGTGVQGRTHLEAMRVVRDITRVRVYSRDPSRRAAFAERETARHGIPVIAAASAEDAVRDADIVCTTTSSSDPVLFGAWLQPGMHVNAVGSSVKTARELDAEAVRAARFYVDRRESTVNESGDFLMAMEEGAVDETHIAGEIGEILLGEVEGRQSEDEITCFKSLGLAVEDLTAAHYVFAQAQARGVGTTVDLGGVVDGAD